MKINFDCEKNLKQYANSILIDSGTIIASMNCIHNDCEVNIDLMVCGEVDVIYKGINYRCASDFPDELKEIIKHNPYWHTETDDLYIADNNWLEYIYDCVYNGNTWSDGILFESDLSTYSAADLLKEMYEIAMEIMED